jgi:hypothetical protein
MYMGLQVKYTLFLWDFNESWNFSTDFRKLLKYEISRKKSKGAESFFADRRTERQTNITKLIVAFRNFANAPKIIISLFSSYNPKGMCLQRSTFWTNIYNSGSYAYAKAQCDPLRQNNTWADIIQISKKCHWYLTTFGITRYSCWSCHF